MKKKTLAGVTFAIQLQSSYCLKLSSSPEYFKIGLKNIKYAEMCHELDNVNNINVKATLNSRRRYF